jgi:hypothetical protein
MKKISSNRAEFYFKGYYAGFSLKRLSLEFQDGGSCEKNQEYVLMVRVKRIESSTMYGEVLKWRRLDASYLS